MAHSKPEVGLSIPSQLVARLEVVARNLRSWRRDRAEYEEREFNGAHEDALLEIAEIVIEALKATPAPSQAQDGYGAARSEAECTQGNPND